MHLPISRSPARFALEPRSTSNPQPEYPAAPETVFRKARAFDALANLSGPTPAGPTCQPRTPHPQSNPWLLGLLGRLDARRHGLLHLCTGPGSVPARFVARSGVAATKANIGLYGGLLFALFLVGWGLAFVWGPIGDKFGRVRTLMLTIVWYSVFTFLSAFVTGVWQLAILRLLAGVGIG